MDDPQKVCACCEDLFSTDEVINYEGQDVCSDCYESIVEENVLLDEVP